MLKLLKCDKLLITKEGLEQVIQNLRDRTTLRFQIQRRHGRETLPSEVQRVHAFNLKQESREVNEYDPNKPLKFKFKILEEYLQEYEKKKSGSNDNSTNNKEKSQ